MILIAGGIGSGKSVVCKTLTAMGYEVYDCDSRARQLMESDDDIKVELRRQIHSGAVDADGHINRRLIAGIVFDQPDKLQLLNTIVHHAVRKDIRREMTHNPGLFVETAIPVSSRLDHMADQIWQVTAPIEIRIDRVMQRNGLSAADVTKRIEAQAAETVAGATAIVNDGIMAVLPQLHRLLNSMHSSCVKNQESNTPTLL